MGSVGPPVDRPAAASIRWWCLAVSSLRVDECYALPVPGGPPDRRPRGRRACRLCRPAQESCRRSEEGLATNTTEGVVGEDTAEEVSVPVVRVSVGSPKPLNVRHVLLSVFWVAIKLSPCEPAITNRSAHIPAHFLIFADFIIYYSCYKLSLVNFDAN